MGESTKKLNDFDAIIGKELNNLKSAIINSDYMY